MNSGNSEQLVRESQPGWMVIASADNNVELIQYAVKVSGFKNATRVASEIGALIATSDRSDAVFDTQITVRGWRVEVSLTAPKGSWYSFRQKRLAETISSRFDSQQDDERSLET